MPTPMSKHDMLFVRACKSKDPTKRLITLHNRLYLRGIFDEQGDLLHIAIILAVLCDKYCPVSNAELARQLHPAMNTFLVAPTYPEKAMSTFMYKIRHTSGSAFPGYIAQLFIRKPIPVAKYSDLVSDGGMDAREREKKLLAKHENNHRLFSTPVHKD